MPKGPQGQKRPADIVGAAVCVARIATGEEVEKRKNALSSAAAQLGRKGGQQRAKNLSREKRRKIAQKAARTRWGQPT
jgi:hypothetical protein